MGGADNFAATSRETLLQFPGYAAGLSTEDDVADAEKPYRFSERVARQTGMLPAGPHQKESREAPRLLHSAFNPKDVQIWEPDRFQMVGKIQDAVRNQGQVHRMRDGANGRYVAVKQMPNEWVGTSHEDFLKLHPSEMEQPWQDIGCTSFLNSIGYPYGLMMRGVFRDAQNTRIVTDLATEGDLFSWCGVPGALPPGPEREALVLPLAKQIVEGVAQLHELGIVHGDISLENVLLSRCSTREGCLSVHVIDFGMTTTDRVQMRRKRGKASYQAPEMHVDSEYDGFLSDGFAVGVTLFALLVKDYPWLATKPGGCKCFDFVQKHGLRAFLQKRKAREGGGRLWECMSEPVVQLLEGLLDFDPTTRLTLGESAWSGEEQRASVWDTLWFSGGD